MSSKKKTPPPRTMAWDEVLFRLFVYGALAAMVVYAAALVFVVLTEGG